VTYYVTSRSHNESIGPLLLKNNSMIRLNMMSGEKIPTPWSKKHKAVTKASTGGLSYILSNSFAEPLTCKELIDWTIARGDKELVEEYYTHNLHYTPNGGSLDLRVAISELYGPNITAEHILVFPGAQVALQTAARVLVDETTHAITVTPCYQSVQEGPQHAGGSVTKLQLRAERGWQLDIAHVEAAIQENTKYIVINEPFNPAGTLMSAESQRKLVTLAEKHGIYILCDEVYRLLEHDPEMRLPAMADACCKGLSVVTLSKPWGACGVTIGWIACQDLGLRDKLTDLQYFGTACPSRASELQAIMVLRASEQILARNMRIILENKKKLERFMDDYSDLFFWVPPSAGAIAAIKFRGPLTSNELGGELAKVGISIKPAYCFSGDSVSEDNDYFRVGFGESIMPKALDALRIFVDNHKDEWRKSMVSSLQRKDELSFHMDL
jgi:aspartate/methionine/tyrosine aminotransferase